MLKKITASLDILTPEGVAFSLPLAGPFLRFLAWVIDFACVSSIVMLLGACVNLISPILPRLSATMSILVYFCATMGYGMLLEWFWRGQTIGKRMLGLRVADDHGLRLKFSQIALRNLLRAVDALPFLYATGGTACVCSRHHQRLGDYAAGTVVIRHVNEPAADLTAVQPGKFNSFRAYPSLEARLRQRVSPQEAGLALQALMRREEFEPEARTRLFGEFAAYYRKLAPFPEEATFALTDEQYMRNVVETLFRPRSAAAAPATRGLSSSQSALLVPPPPEK
ncbi:MAG: RDD family protein [Candidatus Hydrogenedentes bacterium]|nr:RDD family protein [Candidatus Hydrogenedentota bacterium]